MLVVDDDADCRSTTAMLLEAEGYDVCVASDGTTGLAMARCCTPDLVVMDLGAPAFDGYGLIRAIRADDALKGVYIVVVTGWQSNVHQDQARLAGADAYLIKPAELGDLLALLDAARRQRSPNSPISRAIEAEGFS